MLATLLTVAFLAVAALAGATIAASFAKGLAAVSVLRRELALCDDTVMVSVKHGRATRAPAVATLRPARRAVRVASAVSTPARRRVAA